MKTKSTKYAALPTFVALLAIIIATCFLYIPFLNNGLVFDDAVLFSSLTVYDFSYKPFNFTPRTFPYFTLGFTEVAWHQIEAHRIFSLLLHILNSIIIYRLCRELLLRTKSIPENRVLLLAWFGTSFFALHPVAVYGAGYLVQRTILFATLFSLMSLWFYARGLRRDSKADSITAALFYGLAVFSKEHAIMLPLAAIAITPIFSDDLRKDRKKTALYLALCLPSSIWVVLAFKGIVGKSYEINADYMTAKIHGMAILESSAGRWFVSIVTQMGTFFEYMRYWLLPDVREMSIDMRVDFAANWTTFLIVARILGFITCLPLSVYLIRQGGRRRLFGFGLAYAAILFITEFAAMRFQEPFVLYRSYLWALGFIIMLLAILSKLNNKMLIAVAVITLPLTFASANNRLNSMATGLSVWEDAADKLVHDSIPGAHRIYFNRARQYSAIGKEDAALADINHMITLTSDLPYGYLMRGSIYGKMGRYADALSEIDAAAARNTDTGTYDSFIELNRATALDKLGRTTEAIAAYRRSADKGNWLAKAIVELKTQNEKPAP